METIYMPPKKDKEIESDSEQNIQSSSSSESQSESDESASQKSIIGDIDEDEFPDNDEYKEEEDEDEIDTKSTQHINKDDFFNNEKTKEVFQQIKQEQKVVENKIQKVNNREQLEYIFGSSSISIHELVLLFQSSKKFPSREHTYIVRQQEGTLHIKVNLSDLFKNPLFDFRKLNWTQDDVDSFAQEEKEIVFDI